MRWDESKVYLSYIIPHLCFLHFTGMYILRSCFVYFVHERHVEAEHGEGEIVEMYLFNYLWMNCLEDDDISDTVWKTFSSRTTTDENMGGIERKQVLALHLLSAFFPFSWLIFKEQVSQLCAFTNRTTIDFHFKVRIRKDAKESPRASLTKEMMRLTRDLIRCLDEG